MEKPVEVRFDVSQAVALGEPSEIVAWAFVPDSDPLRQPPTVLVCVPGGTYSHSYWDLHVPGRESYSFGEYMADRGFVVVALDNLGTGASTRPADPDGLTFEVVAAANAAVAEQVEQGIEAGTLCGALPPMADSRFVGIGHSLGGMLTATQQALHRSYERVAILGSTFAGARDQANADELLTHAGVTLQAMDPAGWESGYLGPQRRALRAFFHAPDVPEDVLRADDALATVLPRVLGVTAISSATKAAYPASIAAPVFLAFGDHETATMDIAAERAVYASSSDVTFFVLAGSAHCHNMANTRVLLWDRLVEWIG